MKKMNKGFTLVELIIVIAILAIIMLIAIPNFSGIQQRMKVRADKATAGEIAKAVRVWYTDYTTDETLAKTIDTKITANSTFKLENTVHPYALIEGIGDYASATYLPTSLLDKNGKTVDDQAYFVSLSDTTQNAKVIVGISHATTAKDGSGKITSITIGDADGATYPKYAAGTAENYDGTKPGVAYVEP